MRAVVTASGRVRFGGSGYEPQGEVVGEDVPVDGTLATELERVLTAASLANNATLHQHEGRWSVQGDPTEGALLVAARKAGLDGRVLVTRWPRVGELPFSSERKLMSTVHEDTERESQRVLFAKGAPDVLLTRCSHELVGGEPVALVPPRREALLRANESLADQAMRTLAAAYRHLDRDAPNRERRGHAWTNRPSAGSSSSA